MSTDTAPREDLGTVRDAFYSPDPDLSPSERETVFRFSREEDRVSFYTEEAGVGRRLAAHPASDDPRRSTRATMSSASAERSRSARC